MDANKFPPTGMALAQMHEEYTWGRASWNSTQEPTADAVSAFGFAVVPQELLDKAQAARDAWAKAGEAIDDWLEDKSREPDKA